MTKLVKELGISVLISMTKSSSGTEIVKETAKQLSSSAFDRRLEKEADIKAVEYLLKANINVEPLANFLNRLSEKEKESPKYLTWISSHPDSKERAEYIMDYRANNVTKYTKILTLETWKKLKEESEN
jgi:predicted Zn-dependent protease